MTAPEQTVLGQANVFLEELFSIVTMVNNFLNIQIELIPAVVIFVGIVAGLFKIRERFPDFKNTILVVLAFASGFLAEMAFGGGQGLKETARAGFILGSFSAVSYQFIKPFIIKTGESVLPWLSEVLISGFKSRVKGLIFGVQEEEEAADE